MFLLTEKQEKPTAKERSFRSAITLHVRSKTETIFQWCIQAAKFVFPPNPQTQRTNGRNAFIFAFCSLSLFYGNLRHHGKDLWRWKRTFSKCIHSPTGNMKGYDIIFMWKATMYDIRVTTDLVGKSRTFPELTITHHAILCTNRSYRRRKNICRSRTAEL